MPTLLHLHLRSQREALLSSDSAPAQGWFLALLNQIDPEIAEEMHVPDRPRQYAVAPFYLPAFEGNKNEEQEGATLHCPEKVRVGQEVVLRVGLADEALAQRIVRAVQSGIELPRLAGAPCEWSRGSEERASLKPESQEIPWVALASSPPAQQLRLAFVTPTFFSSKGEDLLFPEPRRLWESWRRSWDTWSQGKLPLPDSTPEGNLRVARYQLQTRALRIKGGLQRGFVGELDLEWTAKATSEERQVLAALATLANLTGTGARTALGLGQTRTTLLGRGLRN
jgi:CRISPR/Cas system endoribonuclease Cas6 (RAMP superfamily)